MAGAVAQALRLGASLQLTHINGQPGVLFVDEEGRIGAVMSLDITKGVIQTIRSVINPDKLAHLGPVSDVRALLRRGRTSG